MIRAVRARRIPDTAPIGAINITRIDPDVMALVAPFRKVRAA